MSNFWRTAAQLASGTVVSQVIILLMMPVLTRVLGPASFGGLALFSSTYAVLAGFLTMKYEQSILLPKDDAVASALTALTVQLSSVLSGMLLFAMAIAATSGLLPIYWLCLPICTLLIAIHSSTQQWSARLRDYRAYSSSLILGAGVNSVMCIVLALVFGDSPVTLVLAFTCGLLASVGYMLARQRVGFELIRVAGRAHWQRLARLARQYCEFPIHVLPTSLAIGAASYGPALVIGAVYPLSTTGFYAIATKFVLLPGLLLGGALSEAFRAEFMGRIRDHSKLADFTRAFLVKIALSAVPTCIFLALLAPWAFGIVFGSEYKYSGVLVRFVALGALGMLIAQPFQCVFVGLRRSGLGLVIQLTLAAVPLLLLYLVALSQPIEQALLWHSSSVLMLSLLTAVVAWQFTVEADRQASDTHE